MPAAVRLRMRGPLLEECPEWVHWIKSHHRAESQGECTKEKLQYSYIYLVPLQWGFIFHSWKGNHLSQLLMSESSLETQGCWKAHDTVYICSYVHIWLRLGFRFVPYCGVH